MFIFENGSDTRPVCGGASRGLGARAANSCHRNEGLRTAPMQEISNISNMKLCAIILFIILVSG